MGLSSDASFTTLHRSALFIGVSATPCLVVRIALRMYAPVQLGSGETQSVQLKFRIQHSIGNECISTVMFCNIGSLEGCLATRRLSPAVHVRR